MINRRLSCSNIINRVNNNLVIVKIGSSLCDKDI